MKEFKNGIKCEKSKQYQDTLAKIKQTLENDRSWLKLLDLSIEPTAYNWLTTIPLMEHDYDLSNTTFWDSISIRYDIPLKHLPSRFTIKFVVKFSMQNIALSCKKGGFITLRHNEVKDFTVNHFSEVCHDVSSRLEPQLKPVTGEIYRCNTSNTTKDARFDVSARWFGFVDSWRSQI